MRNRNVFRGVILGSRRAAVVVPPPTPDHIVASVSTVRPPGAGEIRAWGDINHTGEPNPASSWVSIAHNLAGTWPTGCGNRMPNGRGYNLTDSGSPGCSGVTIAVGDTSTTIDRAITFIRTYGQSLGGSNNSFKATIYNHVKVSSTILRIFAGYNYTGTAGNAAITCQTDGTGTSWSNLSSNQFTGGLATDGTAAPSVGDKYLLGLDTASNSCESMAWKGKDGQIAEFLGTANIGDGSGGGTGTRATTQLHTCWSFTTPTDGMIVQHGSDYYQYASGTGLWTAI